MEIERLLKNTLFLQGIPAPTFQEHERAAAVRARMEGIPGTAVELDRTGNLLVRLTGGPGRPVVISAHLDSVFDQATPLDARQESGRIYGPGIGDNSLGLACLIELAHDLKDASLPGDVWLVANVAEEGLGNLTGIRAVVDRFASQPSAYIVIEGMALGYVYHRGLPIRRYRITIQGPGGHAWVHAGRPSAVDALLQIGVRITRIHLPKKPRTTLNIGSLQGGTSINTIAPNAGLELELRSEAESALHKLDRELHRICSGKNLPDRLSVQLELIGERPAGEIPADHPLVQLAYEVSSTYAGIVPELGIASTDASLPLSRGLPAVCIGITHGGNAHTRAEFIETGMISAGYSALLELVKSWMAAAVA